MINRSFLSSFISREEFLGESSSSSAAKRDSTVGEKAERAFNVLDKNHDGYITKVEMMKMSKNLTKEQVFCLSLFVIYLNPRWIEILEFLPSM